MDEMKEYYALRAAEYERIYAKPERQDDLSRLTAMVRDGLAGCRVLEIACGTGWWTERYAKVAAFALGTDINEEVLAVARAKSYPENRVRFEIADAFVLQKIAGQFDAVFAGFWWSHLERSAIAQFLAQCAARVGGKGSGARLMFLDNRYVAGSSTPIAEADASGNTWQLRKIDDGSTHRILKNFPDADELESAAKSYATKVEVTELPYYWLLDCEL